MYSQYRESLENKNHENSSSDGIVVIPMIHFNDVYNAEPSTREPVGGGARFVTAVRSFQSLDPLVLFSGDAFNPSMISTVTQGEHMCPILNALNVAVSVYGNHDFDFGIDNLLKCVEKCNFPWLISNCYETSSGELLAEGKKWFITEKMGVKIGIIGLIEEEWVATLGTIEPDEVQVIDFCESGRALANELRNDHGCDIIIALTHMRWPNDEKLAQNVTEIDLVLGGHDHDAGLKNFDGRYLLKSGTDFRQFSKLGVHIDKGLKKIVKLDHQEVIVDSSWAEDPETKAGIEVYTADLEKKMQRVLCNVKVDLESRFSKIRTEETNLGNLMCDIMLTAVDADCAILNSGSLRSDCVFPAGPFTMKDLSNLLPLLDPLLVLKLNGQQLLEVLENGVSQHPKLEGRFPQVGGLVFGFDPSKEPGHRIDPANVLVDGAPLDLKKDDYRVCVKYYLATGKDGYDVLLDCPAIVDEENGPILNTACQNYFTAIQVLQGFTTLKSKYRPRVVSMHKRRKNMNATSKWGIVRQQFNLEEEERKFTRVAPMVEGRIYHVNSENKN